MMALLFNSLEDPVLKFLLKLSTGITLYFKLKRVWKPLKLVFFVTSTKRMVSNFIFEDWCSRFFRGSPDDNKLVLPSQPRRQKAGSSVTAQKTISRFFREAQNTIISRATHTVLNLHWVASHDVRNSQQLLKSWKKRTGLSSAQLCHCFTTERVKGPLNHVQREIWTAPARGI
jgi:hypothetical protein